ncbi:MAG: CDP-glycerol--glycerophosphate glycerophosphotransferase [Candidatus Shapirobacteria bacterium]|jgi:hypothetical protein
MILKRAVNNLVKKIPPIKKLIIEKNTLIEEKNNLIEEKNNLIEEKNNLIEEKNNLIEEKNNLNNINIKLIEEKETLKHELFELNQIRYQIVIQKLQKKIKQKQKINVIFIVIHSSVWQYDDLYKKYSNDKKYNPIIIVAPYILCKKDEMIEEMNKSYSYFKNKNYSVLKTYNKTNLFSDIKTELQPDIIFFTNPHKITNDKYYINNFYKDTLTCYVPYGIMSANIEKNQYNQEFHNLTWKNFYETEIHKKIAEKYADNKGVNVLVTGYPKCDIFLNRKYKAKNVWKKTDKNLKKIIWAPHHTIENNEKELGYSNFLEYHQIMLDIAKKYQNKIQIAFKPHPILLTKLKTHPDWGERKIHDYCEKWKNEKNTQLELDEYTDLFLSSDGMILDSVSFIAEYMFINKPALFMIKDNTINNKFNIFGSIAYNLLYKSQNKNDLINFIETVILKEKDERKEQREKFLNQYLIPPNNHNATDNIYSFINNYLK